MGICWDAIIIIVFIVLIVVIPGIIIIVIFCIIIIRIIILQVMLNRDVSYQPDPTLLEEPSHVMLNHFYAQVGRVHNHDAFDHLNVDEGYDDHPHWALGARVDHVNDSKLLA